MKHFAFELILNYICKNNNLDNETKEIYKNLFYKLNQYNDTILKHNIKNYDELIDRMLKVESVKTMLKITKSELNELIN